MDIYTIIIIVACVALAVMLCLCLSIANFAYESFMEKYKKLDAITASNGMTTFEVFQGINDKYFDGGIEVYETEYGRDAYSNKKIFLSRQTMSSSSLASFAIVAHELGHALQDKTTDILKRMSRLRRAGKIIGVFMFPLFIAGIIFLLIGGNYFYLGAGLMGGGLLIFLLAVVIKCFTIRIEKEASKNAITFLEEYLTKQELKKCRKFLNDAKRTYWADLFRTLLGWTMLTRRTKTFK